MNTIKTSNELQLHRVSKGYRWFTVVAVPPMLALMGWAALETARAPASHELLPQLIGKAVMLLLYGGVAAALFSGLIWAFRAYVRIDAECMTVHGAYRKRVIHSGDLDGFRIINGLFHVYLQNRSQPIQIAYFERLWSIENWIRVRTANIDDKLLEDEASEISNDVSLGFVPEVQAGRLEFLNRQVNRANLLTYVAIVVAAVNFLFFENVQVERVSIAVLILSPLILGLFALSHRGHIRIDYDEGTRYPQIFTATFASGVTLLLLTLLDRGALLSTGLYQHIALLVLASGLSWCLIDMKRLSTLWQRGRIAAVMTVVAFFMIPAAWVGGSVYQINKLGDMSEPVWHETTVVEMTKSSGKGISYSIDLAPWTDSMNESVRVTLRRKEFEQFRKGMSVRVAVKNGALNTPWVADVEPRIGSEHRGGSIFFRHFRNAMLALHRCV